MRRETAQNRQLRRTECTFAEGHDRASEYNCGQGKFETEIQGRPCLSLQTLHVSSLNEQKRKSFPMDGALRHFVQRSSFGFQQDLLPQLATTFSFSFAGVIFLSGSWTSSIHTQIVLNPDAEWACARARGRRDSS